VPCSGLSRPEEPHCYWGLRPPVTLYQSQVNKDRKSKCRLNKGTADPLTAARQMFLHHIIRTTVSQGLIPKMPCYRLLYQIRR